jgi:hypothetical protein
MSINVKQCLGLAVLALVLTGAFSAVQAQGVGISPASFCLQNMPVGEDTDLGVDLVISNESDKEGVFKVAAIKPSASKAAKLGYEAIPDPTWLRFSESSVKISPKGQGKLRMHLRIPKGDAHYNRHWLVEAMVSPAAGGLVQMAVSGIYMIETKSNDAVKVPPSEGLATVPSIVRLADCLPGKASEGKVTLWNGGSAAVTCTLSSTVFPKESKLQITPTPGYQWVDDPAWIKPDAATVSLESGKSVEVRVVGIVPEGSTCRDQGWESILMVESSCGARRFVRIQLEPKRDDAKQN